MFEQTLNWLTSTDGGALFVVVWAVSWAAEEFERWHQLKPKVRSVIILLAASLLAIVATVLRNNPEWVATVEPYFTPVYYVVLAWLATQTVHKLGNGKAKG